MIVESEQKMSTILDYMVNPSPPAKPKQTDPGKVLKPQLGKQIMQNMQCVVNSLKRKSKLKKHRQKRVQAALQDTQSNGSGTETKTDTETVLCDDDDDEEEETESLASLKKTWLSARDPKESKTKSSSASDLDKKKNAFQMLMLNGKSQSITSPTLPSNDENIAKKPSPDVGKRKKRKVKSGGGGDSVEQSSAVSPKSPAKKRQKKKLFECHVETVEPKKLIPSPQPVTPEPKQAPLPTTIILDSVSVTPTSTRPRRSCAANVTYKDDQSPISTVTATTSKDKPNVRAVDKSKPVDKSIEIIDVEDLCETIVKPVSVPAAAASPSVSKLAPMFLKAVPKPTVDPKVLEARQSFLMSDIPDKMRQEIDRRKQTQEEVNARQLYLFPEISHVSAVVGEMYLVDYDQDKLFPHPSPSLEGQKDSGRPLRYPGIRRDSKDYAIEGWVPAMDLIKTEHQKKQIVRNLKAESDSKFPSFKFYKWLSKRREDPEESHTLFTDKFRAQNSKEFVFNLSAVNEIKEYLEGFDAPAGDTSTYETDDECSNSMDAFAAASKPTLVLHGDCSSGKTSAVYAIAEELGRNVIEINASSKRNGSKVLHKLMEATQSHKVATINAPPQKMSLSRKIIRRMEREEKNMSIILVEDVDIIFAEDNGFLAAITQLMTLTKRPIILTTNNRDSPALKKTFDAPQHNFRFIKFRRPTNSHIDDFLTYLHLVGVVQDCNFDPDYLRHFFEEVCRRDLRQALLQMHFITLTRELPLKWTGETAVVDLPCANLEEDDVEGEDGCADLAWTMDNLCVADRWSRSGHYEVLQDAFNVMCQLGSSLLDSRCDGTFYKPSRYNLNQSM